MRNIVKLGRNIINIDFYIKDLTFEGFNLKIILEHNDGRVAVIDFGKEAIDYRFARELYRINHLASLSEHGDPWTVLLIKDSDYLKKISKEDSDIMLACNDDVNHYLIYDDDIVIDVIAGKDPDIYIKSGSKE